MLLELLYQRTDVYLFYSRPFSTALATLLSFLRELSTGDVRADLTVLHR